MSTPNPGSPQAQERGCTCPVMDNCRGLGRGRDGESNGWWINGDCPLHGLPATTQDGGTGG